MPNSISVHRPQPWGFLISLFFVSKGDYLVFFKLSAAKQCFCLLSHLSLNVFIYFLFIKENIKMCFCINKVITKEILASNLIYLIIVYSVCLKQKPVCFRWTVSEVMSLRNRNRIQQRPNREPEKSIWIFIWSICYSSFSRNVISGKTAEANLKEVCQIISEHLFINRCTYFQC